MRKLLSLVLAFAMILGLFTFPVSADATTYQTVGQELAGLGVLKGVDAKGTLAEMQKLTREQALVVLTRLMGQEDKALATDAQPGFTDVPATHWSAKYVAYAKLQGWTNGTSETQFGLGSDVTTKQVVTLMMRALGYTADWSKEDVVKKAQELGLLEGVSATPDDAIIRGELFIVMKNTLYTKPMGEKIELIYKLGLAENPIPSTLEVVDVKATNLKEVVVEFNQEVDKTTLEDAFSAVGYTLGTITPELQEDGKTVLLTVGKLMKNKENYKVTISKVKSLSGLALEKVTKEFKTQDNEVPKVEKLVVTGPRNFQIIFSEPIKTTGTVKLKLEGKTAAGVAVKASETSERVFDATVASNLQDGKTYTVLVTGFEDYAKYKNIDAEIELEYAKVTDAPTVEVVKATQEYVVFKFNRPVKGLTRDNFYHTYSAWKPIASYNNVEEMDKDSSKSHDVLAKDSTKARDEVVVRFIRTVDEFVKNSNKDLHPLQVGDVEVNVLGQVGSRKVLDNWGNQLQDTELKVTISADKEAPVVENVEVTGEKELEITFSKKVVENRSNYEILNESGGKISGLAFTTSKEGKKVKINVGSPNLVGKTVILNVKDVRDDTINMNKMVGVESFNLTFGDKTFKGIKEAVLKLSDTKNTEYYSNPTFYIAFSEAVDPQSAMDIKNYLFTKDIGKAEDKKSFFGVDADTSMFSDTVVQIVMSREAFEKKFLPLTKTGTDYDLQVYVSSNLKDLAGNSYNAFAKFVRVKNASSAPAIADNEVNVTGYRTVEYSYDLPVITKGFEIDKSQFTVMVGSDKKEIDSVEFNGNKGVKISLADKKGNDFRMSADVADITVIYKPNLDKDKKPLDKTITNELGTEAPGFTAKKTGGTVKLVDKLAPAIELGSVVDRDDISKVLYNYKGGYEHEVKIYFNELMDPQTFSIHTFKLTGKDGSEYKPYGWDLDNQKTAAGKVLTLKFRVNKQSLINTLKQELVASISDTATSVDATFIGTTKQTYFNHFQVQLQEHNSARDVARNGFGSTEVYPVYHTKAMAKSFIDNAGNLADWGDVSELNLEVKMDGAGNDIAGTTQTLTKAVIEGGAKQLKATIAGGFSNVTYQWKIDGANATAAADQAITKPGQYTLKVTAEKAGKSYTANVFVGIVQKINEPTITFAAGNTANNHTVGTVNVQQLAPNLIAEEKAVYFVNSVPAYNETTDSTIARAEGKELEPNTTRIPAKAGDKITVVVYQNVAGGKVTGLSTKEVEENNVTKWAALQNTNHYVLAAREGAKKIMLQNVLPNDEVEIFVNATSLGTVIATGTTTEYVLTGDQKLTAGQNITIKIKRNGLLSEVSPNAVVVVQDDAATRVETKPANIKKENGNFLAGDKNTFTFVLKVDNAVLKSDLQLADVVLVTDIKDAANKGDLAYRITGVQKVIGEEKINVVVEKTGNVTANLSQGVDFKFTVKGTARVDLAKDIAEVTEAIAQQ